MTFIKFTCILFLFSIKCNAQRDCSDAIVVCGNTGFEGLKASGSGVQELSSTNTCGAVENNSVWLKLSIKTAGTLGFRLKPESNDINEDFDFFVFGPNASCNAIGQAIRCSSTNPAAANQGDNYTGMDGDNSDTAEGPGEKGNSFIKWLTVAAGDSYFLVIDRPIGKSNFSLEWIGSATFNTPPVLNIPNGVEINLDKTDIVGVSNSSLPFDLTKNTPILTGLQTDVAISYHISPNDAILNINPIVNPSAYYNIAAIETIYARITNTITNCFNTTSFTIKIHEKLTFPVTKSEICDNAIDGDSTNGKGLFDLNKVTSDIFNQQNTSGYTLNYYLSQNDADTNSNPLSRFFYNIVPNQQSIFIKGYSSQASVATKEIKLIVNSLPVIVSETLMQCEAGLAADGFTLFNLSEANFKLTNNNPDLLPVFFTNILDATNNSNPLNTIYSNTSNPQVLSVRITNTKTNCFTISTLTLKVNVISEMIYPINPACDDDGTEDGIHLFDLKEANIPITSTQSINYYRNEEDALLEKNKITTPFSYLNETTYNQFVFARIEDGNDCYGISKIKLEVNILPTIKTTETVFVCDNIPTYFAQLNPGFVTSSQLGDYDYKWTNNGNFLSNDATLRVNTEGVYKVTVTNKLGCSKTRTIKVIPSNEAVVQSVAIVDLSDNDVNTVTVNVTGKGEYQYSLDAPNGPFQELNFFDNVSSGMHEVYINDKRGCGIVNKTVAVIGVSKYFTPNGDGYNDYWNIKGLNTGSNKNSVIYIFDRYGKLLKQITPSGSGWDGNFAGYMLPADDYWYTVKLEDGRETKGHFSLKR